MGNDAGTMKPVSSYYGELMLRTIDHRVLEMDLLDIQGIHNLPSRERLGQYEQAGGIEFVDLPKGWLVEQSSEGCFACRCQHPKEPIARILT